MMRKISTIVTSESSQKRINAWLKTPLKYLISILRMKILGTSRYSKTNKCLYNQKTLCSKYPILTENKERAGNPLVSETKKELRWGWGGFLPVLCRGKRLPYNLSSLASFAPLFKSVAKQSNKGKAGDIRI